MTVSSLPTRQSAWRITRWRAIGGVAVVLAIAGAALVLLKGLHDPAADFETATVGRGTVEETVTALGKLQPSRYVDVGAQASGQLNRILVQPGDVVHQGQLLAEIDPQLQAAKVDADQAQLAQLRANLQDGIAQADYATAELGRQARLRQADATSQELFEEARRDARSNAAKVAAIRAEIMQAESTLKADQAQLGYTRIFAPISGTVVSVDARAGQTINATYSAPQLLRIADLSTLTVWTQVSEADVTALRPGMALYFTTLGHGDRRWRGRLRQILPAAPKAPTASDDGQASAAPVSPGAGNVVLYTALFDVANPRGELRPDMSAQVFFVTRAAGNATLVPVAALTPKAPEHGLYTVRVLAGRHVVTRLVHIGVHDRFEAAVLAGLAPGDVVVTGLKPGAGKPSLLDLRL